MENAPHRGCPQMGVGLSMARVIKVKEAAVGEAEEGTPDFTFTYFPRNSFRPNPLSLLDQR